MLALGLLLGAFGQAVEGPLVSGTVVDAQTGQPIHKAQVSLKPQTESATTLVAVADQDGHFQFANIAPARYALQAEKSGYIPGVYGSRDPLFSGTTLVSTQVIAAVW